ncbi:MAG: response regulator [Melioribacteraceae bacterium]|nr:response regulator [Melioribacteraceae bacterium]
METILVVEDDKNILENLNEILINADYKTILAKDGKDALLKISSEKPDLIISDIMMPEIDGFELFNRFKEISDFSNVPFIFLSAKAEQSDLRKGMGIGADDYITKPFRVKELLKAVKVRLEKKKKIDQKFDSLKESIALYVPHELRTPLVSILGYSEIMESDIKRLTKAEILEMVKTVKGSASRLSNTIEKFILYSELVLKFSDDSSFLQDDQGTPDSYKKFITEIIISKASELSRINDVDISLEESRLKLSISSLRVIVTQVLDNAIKFSEMGTAIKVIGNKLDNFYKIQFIDRGRGMAEKQIINIDSFVQFERKDYQQIGNGLGLTIVKKILSYVNGNIKIESELGIGTKVEIYLPI